MGLLQIVIIVFVLIVIIYYIIKAFSSSTQLTKMAEGKVLQTIKADELNNANNSSNFTYSTWLYVDDWNYKFGTPKIVLSRLDKNKRPCPEISLGDKPNTLSVKVSYYSTTNNNGGKIDGTNTDGSNGITKNAATLAACDACNKGYTCACSACINGVPDSDEEKSAAAADAAAAEELLDASAGTDIHKCTVENIPIQKWVNVIISLYGRTLDIYIDGKLVRTCVLPGVAKVNNESSILVTPRGGFSGWTSTFKYWPNAFNPQEAYNVYKDGFGGSILGNALSKYRLRFSVIKDNKVNGSFEI